jgi:methyltransferase (TIGR00027 family)
MNPLQRQTPSHTRPPAARTAFGPMVITAIEQFEPERRRIVDDPLIAKLLSPTQALAIRALRPRAVRDGFVRTMDRMGLGMWGLVLCRKRYADDQVTAAAEEGIDQLVVLGAGMDTLAYRSRFSRAFEVDVPANIATKATKIRAALGAVPHEVGHITADFETDDLANVLTAAGVRLDEPTMFLWEAVTPYLTESGVRRTLAALSHAAPGSRLAFSYVLADYLDGSNDYQAPRVRRAFVRQGMWHFGLSPAQVAPFLAEHAWTEREQVGTAEYQSRYLTPTGRILPVSEVERFVLATKD